MSRMLSRLTYLPYDARDEQDYTQYAGNTIKLIGFIRKYMKEAFGMEEDADYKVGIAFWIDAGTFEGWVKPHVVVKLSKQGWKKLVEKGMDEFNLLKNIMDAISKTIPQEQLVGVLISVECEKAGERK